MLEKSEIPKSNVILEEFRKGLFQMAESIAKHNKLLITQYQVIIQYLLPALIKKIESESADTRFLSLKIFTDYISQYLSDEKIYSVDESNDSTVMINELILKKLFGLYGLILSDKDPMPLFGLKLLSIIVDRNQAFITILVKLNLVPILIEYFEVGHSKFNTFTVKIVKNIVQSSDVELQELVSFSIIDKINSIMNDVIKSNQEWCSDHLLEIMNEILHKAADIKKDDQSNTLP